MMVNNSYRRPRRGAPVGSTGEIDANFESKFDDWPVIEVARSRVDLNHEFHNLPRSQHCRHQGRRRPAGRQRHSSSSSTTKSAARTPLSHLTSRLSQAKCSSLVAFLLVIYTASSIPASEGVDCFKCSSRNGTNPACEDPFHNTNTTRVQSPTLPEPHPNVIYHTPCYAGKKGRDGLFPASACIKLTGTFARMSHCGKFQFEGDLLRGCVLACPEDACNSALSSARLGSIELLLFIMWLSVILSVCSQISSFNLEN